MVRIQNKMGKPYVDSQDLGKLKQQVLMVIVIPKNKTSLIKWKKIEILSSIFWDWNVIKLGIKSRKKIGKFTNTWKLNSALLNT